MGHAHRGARPRRSGVGVLLLVALAAPGPASADAGSDTSGIALEVGVGTDFTNEEFYEDAFVDTISLGRRLVSDPETRSAAVMRAVLSGTRDGRATAYTIQNDLSLGDKIQRDALAVTWRSALSPDWRIVATPRLEFRKDRTFDRDLDEWRGSGQVAARRSGLIGPTMELGVGADFLRTDGAGADFLLDRNAVRAFAGVGGMPLFGPEWQIRYGLNMRAFPDSAERDHFEHRGEGLVRIAVGAVSMGVEADVARRVTTDPAPTSRDNFWEARSAADLEWRPLTGPAWRVWLEGEGIRYDVEDTTLYFDYQIGRARLGPRFSSNAWTVAAGPRGEMLRSRINPSEEYGEWGGFVEIEYLGTGFWTIGPAAGWRDYRDDAQTDPFAISAIHSSYAFYEISVIGDQPIAGTLRLHLFATGRYERHQDHAQDSRSLYFSFDLRKLF